MVATTSLKGTSMSMDYITTIRYGFKHELTKESLAKLQAFFRVEPESDYYDEAPEEYLTEGFYRVLEAKTPGVILHSYHSESGNYPENLVVIAQEGEGWSIDRHEWVDLAPGYLDEVQPKGELLELAALLGEEKIGWLVFTEVY